MCTFEDDELITMCTEEEEEIDNNKYDGNNKNIYGKVARLKRNRIYRLLNSN